MSSPIQKVIIWFYLQQAEEYLLLLSISVIGVPVGIASASFSLAFSLSTRVIKKLLDITRNKRQKHNKIVMLVKCKLNIVETLISQAVIDLEICHEDFEIIVIEKEKYEKMK